MLSFAGFLLLGAAAPLSAEQVGSKIPALQLEDTSGRARSTSEYTGKILVLVFWSFKCPVSLGYDARVAALEQSYRDRGVVVLAVASNSNETPAEVQRNVENLKLRFPVLYDRDGALAERVGATHAPSVYILDGSSVLRYRGALDNNKQPGEAGRVAYAEEALSDLVAGRAPARPETREFGCTLKRRAQ